MIPRITRASLLIGILGANLANGQPAMKMGDLILFDSFNNNAVSFYSRDNGTQATLAVKTPQQDGSELFQYEGEIQQAPDGTFLLSDEPSTHVLRVDGRLSASDPNSLKIYNSPASTFTLLQHNLSVATDGNVIRAGYSGSQGAILKHHLDTGTLETLSSGGLLTGDIAAATVALDGSIVVTQTGTAGNLVLVNGATQSALGSSALLTGDVNVYDIEALPNNKVAIAAGDDGVILASYHLNPATSKYETTFQDLGNFGGSVQWAKTDSDGNLLVLVYVNQSNTQILKYDFANARVDPVLSTDRLSSFGVVKNPVASLTSTAPASLTLTSPAAGSFQLSFNGQLQSSTDLSTWTTLSPQPASPYTLPSLKPQEFFRATASGDGTQPLQGNILFRGNSYTYGAYTTGDTTGNGGTPVPTLLKALAGTTHGTFTTGMFAPGGYSFKDHYNDPASLAEVQSSHWHDAVLQNFSTGPSTAIAGTIADHFTYGRDLYLQQIARDPLVNVFLYETPAYRADYTAFYPATLASPDLFQAQLTANYRLLAKNLNTEFPNNPPVTLVPAGQLVQIAGGLLPTSNRFWVQMHATDAMHMSDNRLALTGLAFFVALTHQNPQGLLSTPAVTALGLNITVDKAWLEKLVWDYMTTRAAPVLITDEPQAQSAQEGEPVTFTVKVQGSLPITYQWYKDGTAIPGATVNNVTVLGTGGVSSTYYCQVTNSENSVKSNDAILSSTVQPPGVAALVDFSDPSPPGADTTFGPAPNDPVNHWNTWKASSDTGFAGLPPTLALIRPDGSDGGITLQSIATGGGSGPTGVGNATYPLNALGDFWYGNTANPLISFKIKGLKAARTYALIFYGSRSATGTTADNRQTTYTVIGTATASASIDAFNNSTNYANFTAVHPDADGTITVKVAKGTLNTNASGFFYLNMMSLALE
jgi:hypothetical protein